MSVSKPEGYVSRSDVFHLDPSEIRIMDDRHTQPRTGITSVTFAALKASIKANGVKTPITVRRHSENNWVELIQGERRLRSVQELIKEKIPIRSIPCFIKPHTYSDTDALLDNISGNEQEPLTVWDLARAFHQLTNWGHSQTDISQRTGKSVSFVSQTLMLLDLPPVAMKALKERVLNASQARQLVLELRDGKRATKDIPALIDELSAASPPPSEEKKTPAGKKTTHRKNPNMLSPKQVKLRGRVLGEYDEIKPIIDDPDAKLCNIVTQKALEEGERGLYYRLGRMSVFCDDLGCTLDDGKKMTK